MPGFFVSNVKTDTQLINIYPNLCVSQNIDIDGKTIKRNTLNKFMNDKAFSQTNDFCVVSDGFILNKLSLFEQYGADTVDELFVKMYQKNGDEFFAELRGGFSGAFYDKRNDKWLIFTNQIGDASVYYINTDNAFFAGSQVNYVLDACKRENIKLSFDRDAAYQMLTYAFMLDDTTYAKEIKRLVGGTYLRIQNGCVELKTYHVFKKDMQRFKNASDEELIEEIDRAFSAATKLEYDKDLEYSYSHLTDISGGLDSRMTLWVAHTLGYSPLQLITYCKSNYLDEKIARQIATFWKDEILIKQLDDAKFLYDIDEIVFMNGGLSLYSGISGGNRMLRSMNCSIYGIEHTGINGENTIGSYLKDPEENNNKLPSKLYSKKLLHRLSDKYKNFAKTFEDNELYINYTRSYRGMANTFQIRRNYTEVSAPFLNVEFIQLCFDIPFERRIGHRLYKKWILTKHPSAAQFKWESIGAKINEPKLVAEIRRIISRGPRKLFKILGLGHKINSGMTPLGYWIANDKELKDYLDGYAKEELTNPKTEIDSCLLSDMKELYSTGTAVEKTMVLTVLGSVKLYFGEKN